MTRRDPIRHQEELLHPAALVTGGARRIGREIVLELARMGFDIALHFKGSAADAEETAAEVTALGRKVHIFEADLADPAAATGVVGEAIAAFDGLGVVVNNAAIFEKDDWQDATPESWAAHMAVNLEAPFRIAQTFGKALPADRNGVVVNILDQRVFNLTPHFLSYTLSKSGLWTLTRTLALAMAPQVRVAGLGPGPTAPSARQTEAAFAEQCAIVPLARRTDPAAIARGVRFIVESPSLTGQMIALDGGEHLGWQQSALGAYVEE